MTTPTTQDYQTPAGPAALAKEVERLRAALQAIVDFQPDVAAFWAKDAALMAETRECAGCEEARQQKWPPSGLCNDHYCRRDDIDRRRQRHEDYEGKYHPKDIARAALAAVGGP